MVYRFSKQGQTMVRIDRVISELRSVHRQRPYLTRVAGAVEPVLARRQPAAMPRPAWPSALDTVTLKSGYSEPLDLSLIVVRMSPPPSDVISLGYIPGRSRFKNRHLRMPRALRSCPAVAVFFRSFLNINWSSPWGKIVDQSATHNGCFPLCMRELCVAIVTR